MRIVVIGGTGLIGSRLVTRLRETGHDALSASPASGVDAYTGRGLAQALAGADVVAGVSHHVLLSIVGADRLAESGYFRAKLAQEEAVKAASVPYTILRATQFFEFLGRLATSSTQGDTIHLPPVLVQPEAADDVVAALADVAVSAPVNGVVELAGPEAFRLDELVRRVSSATNDPRRVITDTHARYFGAELDERSLTPGANPRIAPTRFEDWLSRATARAEPRDS